MRYLFGYSFFLHKVSVLKIGSVKFKTSFSARTLLEKSFSYVFVLASNDNWSSTYFSSPSSFSLDLSRAWTSLSLMKASRIKSVPRFFWCSMNSPTTYRSVLLSCLRQPSTISVKLSFSKKSRNAANIWGLSLMSKLESRISVCV